MPNKLNDDEFVCEGCGGIFDIEDSYATKEREYYCPKCARKMGLTKEKQYIVDVTTRIVVTLDTNQTDIETVLQDMDYDFNPSATEQHADIPSTEIVSWEVKDSKDDTFLV